MKADTKIIITLARNMTKLFESNKKLAAISDNLEALIQIYDRPYISYQDICFNGILRSETALRLGFLFSPYQQLFEINTVTQTYTCTFKGDKDNSIGLKFLLFMKNLFNTQLFTIVMI